MRPPLDTRHGVIALMLALDAWGVTAHAEVALEYRGLAITARAARGLLDPALRAPGDSTALSNALGAMKARLEGQGYLDARARGRWDGERLVVTVDEGPRHRLAAFVLRATPPADSARIDAALDLAPGGWASPRAIGSAIERAVDRLVHDGYAYAEIDLAEWSTDSLGARVALSGILGPRVIIEDVRIDGLKVTRPEVARRAMGRLVKFPFQPEAAEAARTRLVQLGLFRSVRYEGLESAADWARGRLVYKVEETRYNRLEGVIGSQGDAGTVGTANLELTNLLGTGRAIALRWDARGAGSSNLGARYTEPLLAGLPLALAVVLDQEVRDSTYTRTRWGGRARWTLSAEDGVELGFEQERVVQDRAAVQQARLENTVFGLERVTLDDVLAPRRGGRVRIAATQTFTRETLRPLGTRSARSSAVEAWAEWIRPVSPSSGIAIEARGAGRFSSQRVLPLYERFPLGGASSLRGHDEEAFRVDRFALTRLEWRWYAGTPRQRVYVFWDHAWTSTRRAFEGGERWDTFHADGFGFGLRIETGAGLAGIDYGLEPGRSPLDGKIHLRLVSTF